MPKKPDRGERKLQRLFWEVREIVISKPACRWTKQELWHAIELFLKRPFDGLLNSFFYFQLESKLRGEPASSLHPPLPEKRGRRKRRTDEEYRTHMQVTENLRRTLAQERGQEIQKITYKDVARRLAEHHLSGHKISPPEYQITRQAHKYEDYIKYLKKKRKRGEI